MLIVIYWIKRIALLADAVNDSDFSKGRAFALCHSAAGEGTFEFYLFVAEDFVDKKGNGFYWKKCNINGFIFLRNLMSMRYWAFKIIAKYFWKEINYGLKMIQKHKIFKIQIILFNKNEPHKY